MEEKVQRCDLNIRDVFAPSRAEKGLLIAVVGFDGSGKTTQVEALGAYFRSKGCSEVIETRQPTDWYRNNLDVQHFHGFGGAPETARILSLLAAADRLKHVAEVIRPALARGAVVICDRYVYATFSVFLHRGVDLDFLITINKGIPRPDLAIYLRVPVPELLRRLTIRDQGELKFEEKEEERIRSLVSAYEAMSSEIVPVDGTLPTAEVTASIIQLLHADRPPSSSG